MADVSKQLAQLRPGTTSNTVLYTGASADSTVIHSLKICNTSGALALARVFHDADGTTYDQNTAIQWDVSIPINGTITVAVGPMNGVGVIAVRTSVSSALTFTLYGTETNA